MAQLISRDSSPLRLAFLYSGDPSTEFANFLAGKVPAHRLFGAVDVAREHVSVRFFRWPAWIDARRRGPQLWKLVQALRAIASQRSTDVIVATTEASAAPLLVAKALGFLRTPLIVLTVAALKPANTAGPRRVIWAALLRQAALVVCYSTSQIEPLIATFSLDRRRVRHWPLGVDIDFFAPAALDAVPLWNVLSVGTNEGKDFVTLLKALPDHYSCLIVTDEINKSRIDASGLGHRATVMLHVPIDDLRRLYRSAHYVVIPLNVGSASSGQTVLLENLVLGRSVVVSDVPQLRDYVSHVAVTLVAHANPHALRAVLESPPRLASASEVAHARQTFSAQAFARRLIAAASEVRAQAQPVR